MEYVLRIVNNFKQVILSFHDTEFGQAGVGDTLPECQTVSTVVFTPG